MPALTASKVTYEYSLQEIETLLARELKVPSHKISVEYVMKDSDYDGPGYAGRPSVVGVKVIVDNKPDQTYQGRD